MTLHLSTLLSNSLFNSVSYIIFALPLSLSLFVLPSFTLSLLSLSISLSLSLSLSLSYFIQLLHMAAEQLKPQEQLTLEPYERDHAVVVGVYRAPKKA